MGGVVSRSSTVVSDEVVVRSWGEVEGGVVVVSWGEEGVEVG